jgi:hypothetical protein
MWAAVFVNTLVVVQVLAGLQAYRAKKLLGAFYLRGSSYYWRFSGGFAFMVTMLLLLQAEGYPKYAAAVVLIAAIISIRLDYLGEHGLKVNFKYIPREQIMGYQLVEGRRDEVDFILSGRMSCVRMQVFKRNSSQSLDELLEQYFTP